MKIPIRAEYQLQRTVDVAVRLFQIRLENLHFHQNSEHTAEVRQIYEAVATADAPVDYVGVLRALDWEPTPTKKFKVSHRLHYLEGRGFLVNVGRGPSRYNNIKGALLYRAVPLNEIAIVNKRAEAARRELYRAIEYAEVAANEVPKCVAGRLAMPNKERDREIIQLRVGERLSLQQVGDLYGVTRERVRQIVEKAMYHKEDDEMFEITIDENVPLPVKRSGMAAAVDWAKMKKAKDSFFLPPKDGVGPERLRSILGQSAAKFAQKQTPPWKFTTQVREENGVRGVRVWRIE